MNATTTSKTLLILAALVAIAFAENLTTADPTSTVSPGSTASPGTSGSTTPGSSDATTSGTCQDDPNTKCDQYKNLCSNAKYHDLLSKLCPVTCNFCGSTDVPCIDNSTNCANWAKNGFCTNPFYTPEQRKLYCAKTCNLC
ncbi:unnamed protein product [Caenorhabditis bovis]|uniref:ShKT domain-containing protein n=1 Tax=Caenorhabditis bovis TaxID=2654633 RepID=A0A8S1EUD5_9PELO|nr:unnamed protein product [Caenorhabditis bovis]